MPLSYRTQPGDLDHLIADDIAVVERQFQHLEAGRGDRRRLVDQVSFELALRLDAEERTLPPAGESEDRHQEIRELLVTLGETEPGESEFDEALTWLLSSVRGHDAELEATVLPGLRSLARPQETARPQEMAGPQEMAELGRTFLAAKRDAPAYAHPNAPSTALGHRIADPVEVLVDTIRDRVSGRIDGLATDPSGLLEPQSQQLLDAFSELRPQPYEILEPKQARRQPTLADAVRRVLAGRGEPTDPEPVGAVETHQINDELSVRVYKPSSDEPPSPLPIVVWVHGGGWVLFTADTYDASCRGLVDKVSAIVVSPEYRKAPEHAFPAAYDDVLATWRWARDNAARLGGDPARMAIGGESAGATMAVATSLRLEDDGDPLPLAQVLVCPLTTTEQVGESMADAADARPLSRPLLSWMVTHAFAGVADAASDPRVDLLSLPAARLTGLPPTLVVTAERDVLRSQGEQFALALGAAGVPVTLTGYPGVTHDFFGASAVLDRAEKAQLEATAHLLDAFGV